jgi:hypothetical protein
MRMDLLFDLAVLLDSNHEVPAVFVHWQMFPLQPARSDLADSLRESQRPPLGKVSEWNHDSTDYGPLASEEQSPLQNTITIYYNYDSLCGGGSSVVSALTIKSAFTESLESDRTSLFHFLDCPNTYATCWDDYIRPERLEELERKRRAMKQQ